MPSAVFRKVLSLPKPAKGFSAVHVNLNFVAPKLRGMGKKEVNERVLLESGDGAWKSRLCWSCWLPRKTGAVILAGRIITIPDTQTLPWVAAASCLDFPKLTKETAGCFALSTLLHRLLL